jgi:hypothetical protein
LFSFYGGIILLFESCCSFLLAEVAKILVFSSDGGNCS